MKTDDEIYGMYCIDIMGYTPHRFEKIYIMKTYSFLCYHLQIRFKEFIDLTIYSLKLDKLLRFINRFANK